MITRDNSKLVAIFFVILASALQIQVSLFSNENYAGLRINLLDIFLPFVGLFILKSLYFKDSLWPKFHIKNTYIWLSVLFTVFLLASLNYYYLYEHWGKWGLINKSFGWLILSAYFLLGGWLSLNFSKEKICLFFKISVYFFIIILSAEIILKLYQFYFIESFKINFPAEGLMANKNSLIFLTLSLCAVVSYFRKIIFPDWAVCMFWFLMPWIFLFTAARAGILLLPVIFLLFLIFSNKKSPWRQIILGLSMSVLLILAMQSTSNKNLFKLYYSSFIPVEKVGSFMMNEDKEYLDKDINNYGDSHRLKILTIAKDMIVERPIIGSGLGSIQNEQVKQWGELSAILDCTPLWLWVETGLIGLSLFLIFYFKMLLRLWSNARSMILDEEAQAITKVAIVTLIVFAGLSLFHEILYTRFLWLFLGLALGLPLNKIKAKA